MQSTAPVDASWHSPSNANIRRVSVQLYGYLGLFPNCGDGWGPKKVQKSIILLVGKFGPTSHMHLYNRVGLKLKRESKTKKGK